MAVADVALARQDDALGTADAAVQLQEPTVVVGAGCVWDDRGPDRVVVVVLLALHSRGTPGLLEERVVVGRDHLNNRQASQQRVRQRVMVPPVPEDAQDHVPQLLRTAEPPLNEARAVEDVQPPYLLELLVGDASPLSQRMEKFIPAGQPDASPDAGTEKDGQPPAVGKSGQVVGEHAEALT